MNSSFLIGGFRDEDSVNYELGRIDIAKDMAKRVKITVLKKDFHPELAERFLTDGEAVGACPILETGDEFIFEGNAKMPEGLCPWAWIDIYQSVSAVSSGSSYTPWNKCEGQTVVCCTDGIRPVIFGIQAMDDILDTET